MYGGGSHYDGAAGATNANSLFGGGGFMPSQSTGVTDAGGAGGSGLSKNRNAQTLLPLTVKQIMDAAQASDDRSNFAVNGVEVSTVRLVGRMLNRVDRVTDVQFTLDDGTGRIDVNRWNGNYVIVNGGLKGFQGKRHVVAYSVRRVKNFNDITHHFLHCIHVHLELTRPKPEGNAGNPNHGNQVRLPNNQTPMAPGNAGNDPTKLVMSVFHDPAVMDLEHGVTAEYVTSRLTLPAEVVRAVIQEQVDAGNVYNTIDDYHFKSVMNG
ncbi:hypothetical protein ACP4OV_006211 [Aristida adscensionis]